MTDAWSRELEYLPGSHYLLSPVAAFGRDPTMPLETEDVRIQRCHSLMRMAGHRGNFSDEERRRDRNLDVHAIGHTERLASLRRALSLYREPDVGTQALLARGQLRLARR